MTLNQITATGPATVENYIIIQWLDRHFAVQFLPYVIDLF